jgi:hypothetical protein
MNVTQANAVVVAAIFKGLSDPRFTMRTPGSLNEGDTIPVARILDVSAEIGLRVLHRRRDNAPLIQRPCSPEQATVIATQAMGVAQGTHESFDVDFSAHEDASIETPSNEDEFPDC